MFILGFVYGSLISALIAFIVIYKITQDD